MKKSIYLLLLLFPLIVLGQSQDQNYKLTKTYKKPSTGTITADDIITNIEYSDGLGRPIQTVAVKAGGNGQDIIVPVIYEPGGKVTKQYLPYSDPLQTSSSPDYRDNSGLVNSLIGYYQDKFPGEFSPTPNPYSEAVVESSPLHRTTEIAAPGKDWSLAGGHTQKIIYDINTYEKRLGAGPKDDVRRFAVSFTDDNTEAPALTALGYYPQGSLYKKIIKKENWVTADGKNNTVEEYRDIQGTLLLKRTFEAGLPHDTYYVYDKFNNLTFVIPPKAADDIVYTFIVGPPQNTTFYLINQNVVDGLCYQYRYDYRNRLVEKKIPGKGWEYIVYDRLDRVVATQDQIIKLANRWVGTRYDVFNRVAYTCRVTNELSRKDFQEQLNALVNPVLNVSRTTDVTYTVQGLTLNYTTLSHSGSQALIYTVNYYDDYNYDKAGITVPAANHYGDALTVSTKGLLTGTKVLALDTTLWGTTIMGYDEKARGIWSHNKNGYLQTDNIGSSKLDFTGKPLEVRSLHKRTGNPDLVIYDFFTYDHAGRLLKHSQNFGSGNGQLIAYNKYDEMGRLAEKKVGDIHNPAAGYNATAALQTVNYSYNVRGWMKGINNTADDLSTSTDLWAFKISYNTPDITASTPLYNGNISETHWKSKTDNRLRSYHYEYDAMNRLVSANYAGNYTLEQYPAQVENYKEGPVAYDKNGNITSLERYGLKANNTTGAIDLLTYSYLPYSNQLKGVNDTADSKGFNNGTTGTNDDYSYDANGNLKKDLNRGYGSTTSLETLYNHLNLPKQVKWAGSKQVNYVYDANGVKLEKKVSTGPGSTLSVTQYDGAFVYSDSGLFFSHPEGYVNTSIATVGGQAPQFAQMEYIYQYKDHLGNVRLSYKKGFGRNSLDVIEEENYYAFGMKHQGYNNVVTGMGNATAQKYEYNSKEYQEEMGLNWSDYGWRNYDATIGRWMNLDPLAERHFNNSPYMYCNNNPVVFLDPDGRDMITFRGTDAATLVATIQGALATGSAWSIEFEWATGSLYAEKDVYDAFEGSGGGGPGGKLLPESFNFNKLTANWQVAGVTGLALSVQNSSRNVKTINFEIEVGLPIELENKLIISDKLAKLASAEAANLAAAQIGTMASITNGKFYDVPSLVQKTFASLMERNLNKFLKNFLDTKSPIGSRINSPIINNINTTQAVWGQVSTLEKLKIWMESFF